MSDSNVFADVPSEGATLDIDKAFDRLDAKGETPAESQPAKEETVEASQGADKTPAEEKVPFHKHPRWQKTQQELKEAREKVAVLEAERNKDKPLELPKWYVDRYGDTEESKKNYQEITQKDGELEWLKNQIVQELEQKTQAEKDQAKEGEEYVDTQLQELTDEGSKFEKNELLKFMVDFQEEFGPAALLDAEGNFDFRKSLELMQRMTPAVVDTSTTTKKELASIGVRGKGSTERQTNVPILSRNALRKGNWRDAETGQFVTK